MDGWMEEEEEEKEEEEEEEEEKPLPTAFRCSYRAGAFLRVMPDKRGSWERECLACLPSGAATVQSG